ncbi:MAG: vanillate O-demethylase oxidoreductase VanB [Archangiaceae bacterium]|nr:vanillate O-demethylase oxidoreductase VanB [Archangiaceae bacterium]
MSSPDELRKTVTLKATPERVWRALSDAREFGSWFGAAFESPFLVGAVVKGTIQQTRADAHVASLQAPFVGKQMVIVVEAMEPLKRLAFRWHPYELRADESAMTAPMTLVTFALREVPEGVELTITESGFSKLPADRRARAFVDNDGGWTMQCTLVSNWVARG